MGAPVAQGFGTIGQQIAERYGALASSRRATMFPILWRTKRTKTARGLPRAGADHDVSTDLYARVAVAPESDSVGPAGSGQPLDLAGRRFSSRTAERYSILRSGEDELRFTHRSGAERWATRLAERGLSPELTWHDENVVSATQDDQNVA
jgi:hypothetical protein